MTQPADKSSFTQHLDRIARSVSFICVALISVASRAAEIFERSKTEQKRELIAFVFFEPASEGEKARVFTALAVRPHGQSGKLSNWLGD